MSQAITLVQYWGGCPQTPNSKWQRFLHLLRTCAARGWRTYLVWSRMPQDRALSRPFLHFGCEIVFQPQARGQFDPACIWRTYRLLRRVHCDVFHCHNTHTSPLIAAALAGVPVRIWSKLAMSPYYERGESRRGLHRLQLSNRVSVALAHRVLCISHAVLEELVHDGVRSGKLVVAPAPVDVGVYALASGDGVRAELGFDDADVLITTVGQAVPVKGWDVLIRAFAAVLKAAPQARLLLVGSTEAACETEFATGLRKLVEELALGARVRFLGQRKDIPRILAASDVFAFPSRSEGQGLALTEALACGLPCVASRAGGIVDLIQDHVNGLLVDPESPAALAQSLITVIRDPELRARLKSVARDSVCQLDLKAATALQVEFYQALLEASNRWRGPSVGINPPGPTAFIRSTP